MCASIPFSPPSFLNPQSAQAIHSTLSKTDIESLLATIWNKFLSMLLNTTTLLYTSSWQAGTETTFSATSISCTSPNLIYEDSHLLACALLEGCSVLQEYRAQRASNEALCPCTCSSSSGGPLRYQRALRPFPEGPLQQIHTS
jgi:hypothetical protein